MRFNIDVDVHQLIVLAINNNGRFQIYMRKSLFPKKTTYALMLHMDLNW